MRVNGESRPQEQDKVVNDKLDVAVRGNGESRPQEAEEASYDRSEVAQRRKGESPPLQLGEDEVMCTDATRCQEEVV